MRGTALTLVNPATGSGFADVPSADDDDIEAAVTAAQAAAGEWRRVTPADRARLLRRVADAVDGAVEELAQLETRNVGKPIADSRGEAASVTEVFHFYAGAVDKHHGSTIPVAGGIDMTFHEPLGVVAAIVPWNYPLAITSWKVAPALACGNTVIVKPAELTPLTALRLAELALEAGLPEGALQVLPGAGAVVGTRLVEHPGVAKVSFTGSTEVGREVMARAAGSVKRLTLELGGKSASIVFADADLERAAAEAPSAVFGNAGQDCCARSRILVEASAYDRFLDLFVGASEAVVVGDPADPATEMGPLVSAGQRERVADFLDGVEPAFVGTAPGGDGFWFPPTVVAPADPASRIAQEEVFGPVVCVTPFADEDEAVRLANATPYGLSGSIWTGDGGRALRMARLIESGNLSINSNTSVRVATPFGGFKQSGLGRELGMQALANYSETKNVFYDTRPRS